MFRSTVQLCQRMRDSLLYRNELSSLHYVPRREFRCTVALMSGLPGSGKDTWLARHRLGFARDFA